MYICNEESNYVLRIYWRKSMKMMGDTVQITGMERARGAILFTDNLLWSMLSSCPFYGYRNRLIYPQCTRWECCPFRLMPISRVLRDVCTYCKWYTYRRYTRCIYTSVQWRIVNVYFAPEIQVGFVPIDQISVHKWCKNDFPYLTMMKMSHKI